jgi:hypothetical protein
MEGFGNAIKYLYQNLILRDVLSYITPGAIIVITAFYLVYPQILHFSYHWLIYVPIFGLFYIVGFSIQCFEEWVGIINFRALCDIANKESTTKSKEGEYWNFRGRFKLFLCKWTREKDNIWWHKHDRNMQKFWDAAKKDDSVKQGHERMVTFQVMCGDNVLAIIVAIIFLAVKYSPWEPLKFIVLGIITIFLVASLFWGHRAYVLRQYSREKVIIESAEKAAQQGE